MTERFPVRVRSIENEALEVRSFELVALDGANLPGFSAGAHIDVELGPGLIRQYSLSNDPVERHRYVVGVKREPQSRGGSAAMHDTVKAGDMLKIGAPRNNFHLEASAPFSLLMAGGIGITPLLSMTRELARLQRPYALHYFARSREHAAFHGLLSREPFAPQVQFHLGLEPGSLGPHIDRLLRQAPSGAHLYLCGPGAFMDLATKTASGILAPAAVHLEYFIAERLVPAAGDQAFVIKLARSGRTLAVPAGRTIIEILRENGIEVETSCEQGVCGTCLTRVLDGIPDHRDAFLTDEERKACDQMTICVSRAKSEFLLLDL